MSKSFIQHDDRPESLTADETLSRTGPVDKSDQRVRRMFGSIARRYDFLNHFLSLNIDRSWRRFTTRTVPPQPGVPVLDCCTGTADLALAYDRAGRGLSPIVGTDFCREMLVLGEAKVRKSAAEGRVILVEGDTQRLPVPDDTFGVVSVAFGLRNVRDTVRGIDEMIRAARPGEESPSSSFLAPAAVSWGGSTLLSSGTFCRASARRSRPMMTTPTITCPAPCSSFPTVKTCSTSSPRAGSST